MRPLERYATWLTHHAWLVLAAVLLVTVVLAAGIARLRAEFDIEASLPANHPFVQIDRRIRSEFGGRNTMIVAIVPREGDVWRADVLEVVQQTTLAALRLPGVIAQNVVSLAAPSVRHVEESGGAIRVDYLMRDVPRSPEEMRALRARLDADPQLAGLLVTPDDRAAILIVDFWEGASGHEIFERTSGLAAPWRDRPLDFYFAGEPMFAMQDREQSAEIAWRIPFTFLVIAVMLLLSFRSVQGMLVPMLTATLSTVWGLGLMGYTGIVIDGWNVAVPILLIAVAAAHSAQMLKRYAEEVEHTHDNRCAVIASTVSMGPVMVAAGLTAALGFASLALFGVRSIGNFGLACAYGIVSAVVLEMTFIPALRSLLPAPRRMPAAGGLTGRLLAVLERAILEERGRRVMVGAGAALVLAAVGALFIRSYGSTREYMPADSLARLHLNEIEKHFPGTVTMTVLWEGEPGSARTVPLVQHVAAFQEEIARDPLVLRTASLADLVKVLHRTFNGDDPDPYRVPDDQELLAQLMYLGDSPAFERFTDRALSKALVVAYLRTDDSARVGPLVRRAETWLAAHPAPGGARVLVAGGVGPTILAVNEHTTHGKLLNTLVVLVVIYLVSSLVLRSPLGGLYVVTPIVATVAILFGLLGWTGIRLDMGSASVIAMAAGIGADYAIYFLYRLREERRRLDGDAAAVGAALRTSGRAVLFVAASIGGGFGVMALSKYLGMRLFGTLMPVAMGVSCIAALSLMPVLVLRTRPAFVFGDAPADAERAPDRRSATA
ncbi:MAG TPA: MMPL family transporter [Candidatus Binatia bacterium]|nr:MMPL family transporter [Candidatus Binatia bacterium]